MPKFAANLGFLFTELPFMERFSAAKKAGFEAVEFMFPYDYNLDEVESQLKENELKLTLFNLPAGNWTEGDRGTATSTVRKEEFRLGVANAVEVAKRFGTERVNCLVGKSIENQPDEVTWSNLIENLSYAADEFAKNDLMLVIEPINHFDMPGFFLNTTEQVIKLLDEINRPNAYLQYDIYHAEREQEDHQAILANSFDKIGHIQIADNPGRHQPGTGTIDIKALLKEIDKLGYKYNVGMEYVPDPNTLASLTWVEEHGYKL